MQLAIFDLLKDYLDHEHSEAALQGCSYEKVFWKYTQQTYWRTPMLKCDFNKIALQLYWNHTSAWAFSCKFAVYFQNTCY